MAAPTTRSLFLFGQLHQDAAFVVRWSLEVEAEADRALVRRAGERGDQLGRTVSPVLVSALRRAHRWGADVIVSAASLIASVAGPGTGIDPPDRPSPDLHRYRPARRIGSDTVD
ncbi:MAG: hypothetical protein LBK42_09245 [Propionibacteriaceae bacterium]|nr:hypothetical protein [Propionibacteriaceae bacterium]